MHIGIVGLGHVGTAMKEIFPSAAVFDEPKKIGSKEEINSCEVTFVCVPTPMKEDGSCDTGAVDYTLSWIKSSVIVLRSTVPVGYTAAKAEETGLKIVFQPEYYGETTAHPFANLSDRLWITLGGDSESAETVLRAYRTVYNSEIYVNIVDSTTAELAKYMENAYLATKVTFCNEFYDIARSFGVDYNKLRETWLMDPRIGRSHTFVYPENRGYGGSCLPKDIAAIIHSAEKMSADCTLLKAVTEKNGRLRAGNQPS